MRSRSRQQQWHVAVGSFMFLKGKDRFNRGGRRCSVLIDNRRDAAASGVITDGRGCVMLVLISLFDRSRDVQQLQGTAAHESVLWIPG
jgi:hypothetical protein